MMTECGQVNGFRGGWCWRSGLLRAERESPLRPCDPIPFTSDLTTSGICAHYSSVVIRTHALTHMLAHVRTHTHTRLYSLSHTFQRERKGGAFFFLLPDIWGREVCFPMFSFFVAYFCSFMSINQSLSLRWSTRVSRTTPASPSTPSPPPPSMTS